MAQLQPSHEHSQSYPDRIAKVQAWEQNLTKTTMERERRTCQDCGDPFWSPPQSRKARCLKCAETVSPILAAYADLDL